MSQNQPDALIRRKGDYGSYGRQDNATEHCEELDMILHVGVSDRLAIVRWDAGVLGKRAISGMELTDAPQLYVSDAA